MKVEASIEHKKARGWKNVFNEQAASQNMKQLLREPSG